jgi:hypothetical protein
MVKAYYELLSNISTVVHFSGRLCNRTVFLVFIDSICETVRATLIVIYRPVNMDMADHPWSKK